MEAARLMRTGMYTYKAFEVPTRPRVLPVRYLRVGDRIAVTNDESFGKLISPIEFPDPTSDEVRFAYWAEMERMESSRSEDDQLIKLGRVDGELLLSLDHLVYMTDVVIFDLVRQA